MKRLDVASAATALKGLYPDCAKEDVKKFAEILSGCDEKTANKQKREKGDIKSE